MSKWCGHLIFAPANDHQTNTFSSGRRKTGSRCSKMYIWVASILVHVLDKQSLCLCICNTYYVCSVKFDGKESYWKQVCRLVPAACDSEVKSMRSDRGGSRTNLGPALETGQPWPPPSIGHPPVSSPRPPSPSFFSKRSALFPSDCVHGDHLWSPRGLRPLHSPAKNSFTAQGTHWPQPTHKVGQLES